MLTELRSAVLTTSDGSFWFWSSVAMAAAGFGLALLWRGLHRARLIEGVPTAKIRSAAQGYIELDGQARLIKGAQILAPLSRQDCVWYHYSVENNGNPISHKCFSVSSGNSDNLFVLEDETGRCVIDPEGAEVHTGEARVWYGNSPWPEHGPLGSYGILALGHRYRYTERIIRTGDPLYAIGHFSTQGTDYQGELKHDVGAILRAWKNDPQKMREFDLNGDGRIDMQEWARARQAAEKEAIEQRARRATIAATHIMRAGNDNRYPFILSTYPQENLTSRFKILAMLGLSMFCGIGLASTWAVLTRLGSF
ncbi:MAG: GIDE domain-containing protein [Pseudomonadota bacterium]